MTHSRDKVARINAFSVQVQNGTFRLEGNRFGGAVPGQQALYEQMTTFPACEHDDMVDAAAFGTEWLLSRPPEPRMW